MASLGAMRLLGKLGGMFARTVPNALRETSRRAIVRVPCVGAPSSTRWGVEPSSAVTGMQIRAASSSSASRKKDKGKAAKKKKKGGPTGYVAKSTRSRFGPDAGRLPPKETEPGSKPLREDLDMSELRIDSLLNELVDGGEGMSNRAKFRALPIDDQIMGRIKREELCTTPSQAGRVARKLRNRNEDTKITRRYPFYQDISPEDRRLLGLNGGKPACTFTHAATNEDSLPPPDDVPEVAFAGRSNVGKSSLINAITLSAAARSSDVPGKTQSLNFYDVSRRLRIVDMPGYGFAFAAPDRVDAWNRLIDKYLTGRANLKRVYVVIDARHGLKAPDREMLAFLSKYGGVSYQVVLNKTDLVKPGDLARRAFLIREELRLSKRARGIVDMASTSTGAGVRDFARGLLSLAIPEKAEDDGGRTAGGGGGGEADDETDDERESYGGEWKPNSGDASVAGGGKKARPRGWGSYAADDDDDDERPRAGGLGGEWKPGRGATPRPGGGRGGRGGRGGGRGRGGRGGGRGRAR